MNRYLRYGAAFLAGGVPVIIWSLLQFDKKESQITILQNKIVAFEQEFEKLQKDPTFYLQKAAAAMSNGSYNEAVQLLSEIEKRFPSNPIVNELSTIRTKYTDAYAAQFERSAILERKQG